MEVHNSVLRVEEICEAGVGLWTLQSLLESTPLAKNLGICAGSNWKHCVWKMEAVLIQHIKLKCKQFLKPCISKGIKCIGHGWRRGHLFTQQNTFKCLQYIAMLVTTGIMEICQA